MTQIGLIGRVLWFAADGFENRLVCLDELAVQRVRTREPCIAVRRRTQLEHSPGIVDDARPPLFCFQAQLRQRDPSLDMVRIGRNGFMNPGGGGGTPSPASWLPSSGTLSASPWQTLL